MIRGIYRIAGPDLTDYRDCNAYIVEAGELVMIDSGFGENPQAVMENIARAGLDPFAVSTIVLTHCHIDHMRGAAWFRDHLGAKLVMHEEDAAVVERGDNRLTAAFCFEVEFDPLPIDVKLAGSEGLIPAGEDQIAWLHTPGHSAGSISVYLDGGSQRILFGQDIAAPLLTEFDCDPAAWFSSMERLLALDADVLCDGHSGIYQPGRAVRRYIEHFVKLRRQEMGLE